MAQFLTPGIQQLETAAGAPLAGGKCHVYQVATTTPLALFSDESLTTPASNPLVADSSGSFPAVFLAETKAKLVIVTSTDAPFDTRPVIYTTGVASAVPATGVSYDGSSSGLASTDVQSAIDEAVELQGLSQSWNALSDGTIATGTSTNAGAGAGPDMDMYRNSASPAASDLIGGLLMTGQNAAGSKTTYGYVRGSITDATNGSEDGKVAIGTVSAGASADRLNVGAGIFGQGATDPGSQKANFVEVQQAGAAIRPLVAATRQTTASGTAFDFSSIPSWVTRINVLFSGVSLSGTDNILVQIGDSGGISSTGYASTSTYGTSDANSTAAFIIRVGSATAAVSGKMSIELLGSNIWSASQAFTTGAGTGSLYGGGTKTLSGALDRVRITRDGTNNFDAGSVNITYE